MSDLVKRLRDKHCCTYACNCDESADRIEQLDRELADARSDRAEWMAAIDQANKNGVQYEALQAELAAEKALADQAERIFDAIYDGPGIMSIPDNDIQNDIVAYRKARGL